MLIKIYQNDDINIDTDIFDNDDSLREKISVKLGILPKYLYKRQDEWINLKDIVTKDSVKEIALLLSKENNDSFLSGINDSFLFLENKDLNDEYVAGYYYLSSIREKIITLLAETTLNNYKGIEENYLIPILKDEYKDMLPDYWSNSEINKYFEEIFENVNADKMAKKSLKKLIDKDSIVISEESLPEFSELKPVQQRRIITLDTIVYDNILYYFDKIRLNSSVVFASINNLYKITKNFEKFLQVMMKNKKILDKDKIINKLISKTRDDCILIKYKTNQGLYKTGYIFIENSELKIIYNNLEEYNDKILSIWDIKKIKSVEIAYIKAKFQIIDTNFNKTIFSYLAMNDPLFSKYIRIDDFQSAIKIKSNYTVYYYDPNIRMKKKSTICGMDLKSFKDFDYIKNKGQITIFMTNIDNNININIRRSPGIEAIEKFMKIFRNLYAYYRQNIEKVEKIYSNIYGINIGQVISDEEENLEKQNLLKRFPEIFSRGYRTNCTPKKRPHILDKKDVGKYYKIYQKKLSEIKDEVDWEKLSEKKQNDIKLRLLNILKFPASPEDEEMMNKGDFPSTDDFEIIIDGKKVKSNWYVCDKANSGNIIPAENKNIYPRLSTNRGKNKSDVPLVPCCIAKIYGKKRNNKTNKTQSSELKGNKLLSKGSKGHLPTELQHVFNYLDPLHTYHRYGIGDSPDSIIKILNKIFKKKYNREDLLTSNLGICKQENYDKSLYEIEEYIRSDKYLDPKILIRLLENKYNCNIYIFNLSKPVTRHDKIKEIPRLAVPKHFKGTNYYTYDRHRKSVIIFEHYGNDIRSSPNCEFIFRTDYNNYNSEYSFNYSDIMSNNLRKYFNLVNLSYFSNIKNMPIYNFNIPDIQSQIIDTYGKCRGLLLKNNIIILTQPLPPLDLPVINSFEISEENKVLEYLKESKIFLKYVPNIVDNKICGYNCRYNNVELFLPCKMTSIESDINSEIIYCNDPNKSELAKFNGLKKTSKYLKAYCKYLYSIKELPNLDTFFNENIQIISDHQYDINISPFLTLDNSYIKNGMLIVTSTELKDKLKYMLKLSISREYNKLVQLKTRKLIDNYYQDSSDFTQYDNQIILRNNLPKYFQYNFNHNLQLDTVSNVIVPYFVLKEKIYIYQNSYSEISKEYIDKKWSNERGYNDFSLVKLQKEYLETDNDQLLNLVEDNKLLTHILTTEKNEPKYISKLEL